MLQSLFEKHGDKVIGVARKGLTEPIPTFDMSMIMSCCSLLKSLTRPESGSRLNDEPEVFRKYL